MKESIEKLIWYLAKVGIIFNNRRSVIHLIGITLSDLKCNILILKITLGLSVTLDLVY